ncbi:MAG: ADP-ribosylation factor-like protein [Promethearchaeota archaeon]
MALEITKVINLFSKFLDPEHVNFNKLKSINDLLKLPIYSYKFLDSKQSKLLEDLLDIINIGEAAKLNKNNPFEKLINLESIKDPVNVAKKRKILEQKIAIFEKKYPELQKKLIKTITISSLIKEIKIKKLGLEKERQKIIVIGLDNAGKTAMLNKFGGRMGIEDLVNLKPTKGVHRKIIENSNLDLVILDMGGQKKYRNVYLEKPENYFLQIDLLIYIIDLQDPDRFEESFQYFGEIIDILIIYEENPHVLIYLNKYDPELKNDPNILLSIELLKEMVNDFFQNKIYELNYETYLTSIYSTISHEPKFSKFIKDTMRTTTYSLTDPIVRKVEGMGKTLEETMNAIIRLTEGITIQLNNLDSRLKAIESGAFEIAQSGIPIEIKNPQQIKKKSEGDDRANILDELKDLFKKKRRLDL